MLYLETIKELLEVKEGEYFQFKEAKNRFDFGEAAKCCCALANNGGVNAPKQVPCINSGDLG